jgi:predicted transcriptional regulator
MRTTLDIDDDVLAVVKDIAAARRISAGAAASELIRKALTAPSETGVKDGEQQEYILDGFPVFASRGGKVTHEEIKRLLDEED